MTFLFRPDVRYSRSWRGLLLILISLVWVSLASPHASAQASAFVPNRTIVPQVRIGGLVLRAKNIAFIKRALGPGVAASATQISQKQAQGSLVGLLYQGQVVEIETDSPLFATIQGIRVGSPANAVKAAFGAHLRSNGASLYMSGAIVFQGQRVQTYFDLNKGRVVSIRIGFAPWLTPCYGGPTPVNSDLTQSQTWGLRGCPYVVSGGVNIPQGDSLTILPGVVVKFADSGSSLIVNGGALRAIGTADAPVVFTSLRDQNHGALGTARTLAHPGDWLGISVAYSGGQLVLAHAQIFYAGANNGGSAAAVFIQGNGNPAVSVSNSEIAFTLGYGIDASAAPASTTIQRTLFLHDDRPLQINGGMNLDDSNVFTANKQNGVFVVDQATIAQNGITVHWTETHVPFVIRDVSIVGSGGTLVIGPGVMVKARNTRTQLQVDGGTMQVKGTAQHPAIFTSFANDAYGGDTNGDGHATVAAPGDWEGLTTTGNGGTLILHHAEVLDAGADNAGESAGLYLGNGGTQSIDIEDSVFALNGTNQGSEQGWGIDAGNAVASARIVRTTFYGNDRPLQISAGVSLDNSNIFHGPIANKQNGVFLTDQLDLVQGAMTIDEAEAPIVLQDTATVEQGATLTLGPGVVLKGYNTRAGLHIAGGNLQAIGSAAQPVMMTSFSDDTHGGDTNGDGTASQPHRGDWGGLTIDGAAAVTMKWFAIEYAGANSGNQADISIADTASVSLANGQVSLSAGDGVTNGSPNPVSLTNVAINDNTGYGINYTGNTDSNNVPLSLGTTTLTGVTFNNNGLGTVGYADSAPPTPTPVPTATPTP